MKIFKTLATLGLVSSQAPDPQKVCTDCKAFGVAYKDEINNNPGMIDKWCTLAEQSCDSAPAAYQKICRSVASKALHAYLEQIYKESPTEWCTHVTMCPNTKNFWVNGTTPQDCAACTNFMTDLQLIAINDPNHFAQFYKVVTTDICKDLGGFEAKVCLSEVGAVAGTTTSTALTFGAGSAGAATVLGGALLLKGLAIGALAIAAASRNRRAALEIDSGDSAFLALAQSEPAQCYRRFICDLATGEMPKSDNDIITSLFNKDTSIESPKFDFATAAKVGKATQKVAACELRYSCPLTGAQIQGLF